MERVVKSCQTQEQREREADGRSLFWGVSKEWVLGREVAPLGASGLLVGLLAWLCSAGIRTAFGPRFFLEPSRLDPSFCTESAAVQQPALGLEPRGRLVPGSLCEADPWQEPRGAAGFSPSQEHGHQFLPKLPQSLLSRSPARPGPSSVPRPRAAALEAASC